MSNNQADIVSLFQSLIQRSESETLDFKREAYDLSNQDKKVDLVKDIVCMYNTPRQEDAHIVLGVKDYTDRPKELFGIDFGTTNPKHLDQSSMQSAFTTKNLEIQPLPRFTVETFQDEGKNFAIITIPINTDLGPSKVITSRYKQLENNSNILYFRRGTENDHTRNVEESSKILQWFKNPQHNSTLSLSDSPQNWDYFLEKSFINRDSGFELSRKYIIIVSPLKDKEIENLPVLSQIPALLVLDFDCSDKTGLFSKIEGDIKTQRSLHKVVKGNRPTINPEGATYWFFLRGLEEKVGSLSMGDFKTWKKHYVGEISEQLRNIAKAINPTPITCLVLWYENSELNEHLDKVLNSIEDSFSDAVNFVFVTKSPGEAQEITKGLYGNIDIINIDLHQLCSGLKVITSSKASINSAECFLPSSSGADIPLGPEDRKWLEEEFEIVHRNVGQTNPYDNDEEGAIPIGGRFLRGSEITWHELNLSIDVHRDITDKIKRQVKTELDRRRAWRINLYHEPGAGGTTVARRILWDLHETFPCVILKRSKPDETSERLSKLAKLTDQPILLLIDNSQVPERQVDELYNYVRSNQVSAVFLQVQRRSKSSGIVETSLYLESVLSTNEFWKFVEKLSLFKPEKKLDLRKLVDSKKPEDKKFKTAFYLGLATFEHEFLGIEKYVDSRIKSLKSEAQKKILLFLAISYSYAQSSIKSPAFAEFLNIPLNQSVHLEKAFSSCRDVLALLIEEQPNSWRTMHVLVAQEILKQGLIPPQVNPQTWNQYLSGIAKEFAEFCRGNSLIPSEEMLELVRRTFIYRDNSDVLGTEKVAANQTQSLSQLLQDIPSYAGRVEILNYLTELYPDEAHFWAHLGRFYAAPMKDYAKAIEYIDKGISLTQEKDHVLYHMKGMAIRHQVNTMIENKQPIQTVVNLAKTASEAFEKARELSPENEHGYISEVQLLAKILDYAGTQNPNRKGVINYLSTPGIDPFLLNSFERAEDLLEQVRRNREGQRASSWEAECRAKLDILYGKHEQALQAWENLLSRKDTYSPPLRRQIIWTYLAKYDPKHNRSWNCLPKEKIQRITSLLAENLDEDPSNDKDLRLWIQAVRWSAKPPRIEFIIDRVTYWKTNSGNLDSVYYLYLLNVLSALEGSALAKENAERYMEESRHMARFRKNRTNSFEWLGDGVGINRLVHHSELGEWNTENQFWETTSRLVRLQGRVKEVKAPQQGYIQIEGGLLAFYVPSRSNHSRGRSENQLVDFYLGFSYDGLRAWEVKDI